MTFEDLVEKFHLLREDAHNFAFLSLKVNQWFLHRGFWKGFRFIKAAISE